MPKKKEEVEITKEAFAVDKEYLLGLLNKAKTCLVSSASIPILEYICFSDNRIRAFNGIQGIEIISDFEGNTIDCCVQGAFLTKLLESYSKPNITFFQDGDTLKANNTSMATIPVNKFLFKIKDMPATLKILTISPEFNEALKFCLPSASNSSVNEEQNGITLHIKEDGSCSFGATNGQLLAFTQLGKGNMIEVGEYSVVLPKKFCEILTKVYSKEYVLSMYFYPDCICVRGQKIISQSDDGSIESVDEFTLYTKITPEILDYETVLEMHEDNLLAKNMFDITPEFAEVVNRINLVAGKDGKVSVESDRNLLTFTSKSANARSKDTVVLPTPLPEFSCTLSVPNLKQFINAVQKVSFYVYDEQVIFVGKEGEANIQLLNDINS